MGNTDSTYSPLPRDRPRSNLCLNYSARRVNTTQNAPLDFETERARLAKAQAEHAELKAQLARGELITVDQFRVAVVDAIGHVREKFDALASEIAPLLFAAATPSEAEAILASAFETALDELTDDAEAAAADDPGGPQAA